MMQSKLESKDLDEPVMKKCVSDQNRPINHYQWNAKDQEEES